MVLCPQHHRRVSSCYRYATDAAAAGITVVTSRMSPGLRFADRAEAEAVAAAWAALAHGRRAGDEGRQATSISLSRTRVREYYFAVDFGWRAATLDHFFAAAGRSTFSALAHVSVAGEGNEGSEAEAACGDTFTMRMLLRSEHTSGDEEEAAAAAGEQGDARYWLGFKLVGAKSAGSVYETEVHPPSPPHAHVRTHTARRRAPASHILCRGVSLCNFRRRTLGLHRRRARGGARRPPKQIQAAQRREALLHSSPCEQVRVALPEPRGRAEPAQLVEYDQPLDVRHPLLAALRRTQRVRALVRMRCVGPTWVH